MLPLLVFASMPEALFSARQKKIDTICTKTLDEGRLDLYSFALPAAGP
jgi:hypothetical protein